MGKEILDRIMTATAYQKKAVYALFPEEMGIHLDAIEKEIMAMVVEIMEAWLRDEREKSGNDGKSYGTGKDSDKININAGTNNFKQQSGAKKIDII
ncbi:MAG: hypothetical protein HDR06_14650 [Lachnospiraceae bacterium]|nr:hypothetical protein [Lachnospiraceae bacterium]